MPSRVLSLSHVHPHRACCSEVGGGRTVRRRIASLLDEANDAGSSGAQGARGELSSRKHGGVGHCELREFGSRRSFEVDRGSGGERGEAQLNSGGSIGRLGWGGRRGFDVMDVFG